ncbi:MAG: response regulator transcription factor [Dethiobacter sp.]|nr:response regulator transcription factor [Dethiobacter sp.]
MATDKIRLFIVDSHEVIRLGFSGLFADFNDLEVVGEAGDAESAIKKIEILRPHVVFMDLLIPGMGGIEACRLFTALGAHVIMLTSFYEPGEIEASFEAGASGYVLKNISSDNLLRAIRTVSGGEVYLEPESTERVFKSIRSPEEEKPLAAKLSGREEEILALVASGKTNREIARLLYLSENTVRNHVSRILHKLGFRNRSQAVLYMARRNIVNKQSGRI